MALCRSGSIQPPAGELAKEQEASAAIWKKKQKKRKKREKKNHHQMRVSMVENEKKVEEACCVSLRGWIAHRSVPNMAPHRWVPNITAPNWRRSFIYSKPLLSLSNFGCLPLSFHPLDLTFRVVVVLVGGVLGYFVVGWRVLFLFYFSVIHRGIANAISQNGVYSIL